MQTFKKEFSGFKKSLYAFLAFFALIFLPVPAFAFTFDEFWADSKKWFSGESINVHSNESTITTEINVSTNTGGNVTDGGGTTHNGETRSRIHIEDVVNGKKFTPIDIESQESRVEVNSEITADQNAASVKQEITVGDEKKTENYEVDLNVSAETEGDSKVETEHNDAEDKKENNWWGGFKENFKSFLKSIFNIFK